MEILLGLLHSLNVDSTIWIQFAVFVVTFIFLTGVVFSPYVKAYEERQLKTKGNHSEAEKLYAQSRELETLYQRKARNLNSDIKVAFDKARSEAVREQERIILEAREKSKLSIDKAREKIQEEFNKARESLIKEAPAIGEAINGRLLGKDAP